MEEVSSKVVLSLLLGNKLLDSQEPFLSVWVIFLCLLCQQGSHCKLHQIVTRNIEEAMGGLSIQGTGGVVRLNSNTQLGFSVLLLLVLSCSSTWGFELDLRPKDSYRKFTYRAGCVCHAMLVFSEKFCE